MEQFDLGILQKLYKPRSDSHKGENGKLLIIGGSKLFHSASLWSLKVASRIVDMVFYSSTPENNRIVEQAKKEFRDGIIVPRNRLDDYIKEADCVLIGPGLPRFEGLEKGDDDTKTLTENWLKKYPDKKWVIDGGSLQTINVEILLGLKDVILTPHHKEFEILFEKELRIKKHELWENIINAIAKKYKSVILLKGERDLVCSPEKCLEISGGNAGMTKGGTGDVLAGLVAALYCKNDAFISAAAGSFINKKTGERLFKKVGYFFNASDLADEMPEVMKNLLSS